MWPRDYRSPQEKKKKEVLSHIDKGFYAATQRVHPEVK